MTRGSFAPNEVLEPVQMKFCANPTTAQANLLSLTTTFVNKVLPAGIYRGYLPFLTRIYIVIITMDNTGNEKHREQIQNERLKMFLNCLVIGAGRGMKIPGSPQRNSLHCMVGRLIEITDFESLRIATDELIQDVIEGFPEHP